MGKVNVEKWFVYNKVMNMNEYNPVWYADGTLVWKKIGAKTGRKGKRRKKQMPCISMRKIRLDNAYEVDEEILEASRKQYKTTGEMIPVYLSYDFRLLKGYEQYVLAKELGMKKIPFQRRDMTKKEKSKKKVTNKKMGNKKYPLTTKSGNVQYLTLNKYKKAILAKRVLRKVSKELRLIYLGNLKFTIENENGERLLKQKKGVAAITIVKFLQQHDYINGQFVKKPDQCTDKETGK